MTEEKRRRPGPKPRPWNADPRPNVDTRRDDGLGSTPEQREKWRADYAASKERRKEVVKAYRDRNPGLTAWWKRRARREKRDEIEMENL
jgi:hypothetical protein